ncbi:MAG: hypothetical protein FJX46_12660 [Alphaproteobacteria bacterium]|nr:hypothetical protein [Alphaproteobacteria bacterium]
MSERGKDRAKPAKGAQAEAPPRRGSPVAWVLVALLVLLLGVATPTFIVIFVGMIPALVAIFIERGKDVRETMSVAALNFAGVAPVVATLWRKGHTITNALHTIQDLGNLFIMFGAAGLALAIMNLTPKIALRFITALDNRRVKAMREQQKEIVAEWGVDVRRDARL